MVWIENFLVGGCGGILFVIVVLDVIVGVYLGIR